jgi:phage protein D/phage baseplate assembly protein gpV
MPAASSSITVPLYRVMVDGAEIDAREADCVHEIKITDWLRLPDVCTLAVGYPLDEQGTFRLLDSTKFKIGAELEVKLGSTDQRTTQTIFKGEIVTVEPDFQSGSVAMVVRAYDKSHRLMRSRKQRAFLDKTISDIVKQVGGEYGMSVSTGATGGPLDFVLQHNETDWDFLWRLARRVGCELTLDERTLKLQKPGDGGAAVELAYPDQLFSFRPRITAVQQVKKVTVRGFDYMGKRSVVSEKNSPTQVTEAGITRSTITNKFPDSQLEIAGQSFVSKQEADNIAQGALDQLANAYLAAEGSTAGNPAIKAGVKLTSTGVGADFSGTYRVAKAVHVLRTGGYVTQFANSAGEHTLLGQTGANGSAPGKVDSLVVGIVTNNKDPEKLGRVKVKLPFLSEQETFWAPVLLPAAGKERGVSMLPVPDEQVIIAFENGDPSFPIVLGSVFNGKDTPGEEMAVQDGSFALKSDKKALIAAKEDINLRTDKGKWVIDVKGGDITETVKAGGGGSGNYTGTFDGAYKVKASQAITVESSMGITIKAPQIKVEAQGQLTVESKGVLELKGATVQINGQAAVNISGGLINLG